jgi:HPt (histidine-containing phosphotransfer) domain-containing protein/HAMP domain-containing protein
MGSKTALAYPHPVPTVMNSQPPVAVPRFLSVGGKLAGATVALMLVVTAVVYWELSAYQREHLLQAKQRAALAVTRLFADSCAAPIVFGDTTAIDEALQRLGKSDDIPYAAVWNGDEVGRADQRLAELGARVDIPVGVIPEVLDLRREPNRLVLLAPVRDVAGKLVGAAVVTFSLLRENAVIAQVQSNTLYASGAIATWLTLLLLTIARIAIVRPLGKLVVAANEIERGKTGDIEIRSRDEIGQLAAAFRSMAHAIANREERIVARNRDMRLVLDNVGQGFLTLDLEARLSEERSRVVEEWFGVPPPGAAFGAYIAGVDPRAAERFEVGWMLVSDPDMPPELSIEHLPKLIHANSRTFELSYRPISRDEHLHQLLVVITDVSARIERERALVAERETMSVFKRVLSDRTAFEEFFDEATSLVASIRASDGSDRPALQRDVHTLKGNAAVYGLESIADLCHTIESELESSEGGVADARKRELEASWARVGHMRAEFSADSSISVGRDEHRALLLALEGRGITDLAARLESWQFEPASRRLELIGRQIQALAQRLGKGEVSIHLEPTDLRLQAKVWGPLWAVLTHFVRNTVDHGLEDPEQRVELGKPRQATVTLALSRSEHELTWSISDDGRGIDWSAIAARARGLGLPADTHRDLEAALFAPGVSSKDQVTATSGRGVGLSVVREAVNGLGGRIEVQSERGKGTRFAVHLPVSMLNAELSQPREISRTGRPGSLRTLGVPA